MIYGYARVSSKEQNLARQIEALSKINVDKIFKEKASGADIASRPVLKELIATLEPDDVLTVISLDRLGRKASDVTKLIFDIKSKGANIEILDLPNFSEVKDDNTRNLISTIIVELQKYVAEVERKKIHERQRQGIELAKKRGAYRGRPILYGPDVPNVMRRNTYFRIKALLKSGNSVRQIQRLTHTSNTLIKRIEREL